MSATANCGVKIQLPKNATIMNKDTLNFSYTVYPTLRAFSPTGLTGGGGRRPRRLEDVPVLGHHEHRDEVHHGEGEELSLENWALPF